MSGPLAGFRILEMAGLGPGPFCGMTLADLGADVTRVERPVPAMTVATDAKLDMMNRGKRSIIVDLKSKDGAETMGKLLDRSDGLFEGFRPGVMERNGFGPDVCLARKPTLVYGRVTGWGQTGPWAKMAGHDINYLSLTGVLGAIGEKAKPAIPLNLVADFAGGAMFLLLGMVSALLHVQRGGKGQVIDASMIDGAASLTTAIYGLSAMGQWNRNEREANLLDGAAHFYSVYETKDGEWVSVGAIEPQFHAELLQKLELTIPNPEGYLDRARWPELKKVLAARFKDKTRAEWDAIFAGGDACYAPVLHLGNAAAHPHNVARGTFVEQFGALQPGPAPRFSETPQSLQRPPPERGQHTAEILAELG